ncbi:MAG: formyltetrahydrofolate deformylase [Pseudomonadota bacterium]
MMNEYVVLMSAPDRSGILARVAAAVTKGGGDVRDAASFGDATTGRFFLRIHLSLQADCSVGALRESVTRTVAELNGEATIASLAERPKVMIAVSRFDHCLVDLLMRFRKGQFHADLVGVFSNHDDTRDIVEWYGLPFHHLPISRDTKSEQERQVIKLIADTDTDLLVLARYMQILSPALSQQLQDRCINIHHSFLPSFKGAKPYGQAYERGVKLIGATAHYVTDDLDEGPIIEQDVRRVTHATSADEMTELGREIECSVLARAVRWHLQHRIIVNGRKTVVFNH